MNKYLLFLLSLLFFVTVEAQEAIPHVYIKMNWKDSDQTKIQVGKYNYDEDFHLSIHPIEKDLSTKDSVKVFEILSSYLNQVEEDDKEVLYYVHGFSADSKWYQKYTNSRLQKHVYNKDVNPYGLVINLIWNSSPIYVTEKKRSFQKGQMFGRLTNQINRSLTKRPSILCHSMGNRVLGGIIEASDWTDSIYFNRVIMACPDIESSTICEDPNYQILESKANNVFVYVHNNDRVLTLASQTNKTDRLGHKGPSQWEMLPNNVIILDASLIDDNSGLASQFSNHRYFFDSPTGREDLMESLGFKIDRSISRRTRLDRDNRYVIENIETP